MAGSLEVFSNHADIIMFLNIEGFSYRGLNTTYNGKTRFCVPV